MDAAVAAAVESHAVDEAAAAAHLAVHRAKSAVASAKSYLNLVTAKDAHLPEGTSDDAPTGGLGGVTAGGRLPKVAFDSSALQAIEAAGPLLTAAQLPSAVAAVFASLRAACESGELALDAQLAAAKAERMAAEAQRNELASLVEPYRKLVPRCSSDDLHSKLQLEVSKRQQLDAEFRLVKDRVEEISTRAPHGPAREPMLPLRPRPPPSPHAHGARLCLASPRLASPRLRLTGLDWTGLDWTGLDWTGLNGAGLDWTGLERSAERGVFGGG